MATSAFGDGLGLGTDDLADLIVEQLKLVLARERVRVIDLFRSWDADGDERISKAELGRAFAELGFETPDDTLDSVFRAFDRDGNQSIDFQEAQDVLRSWAGDTDGVVSQLLSTLAADKTRVLDNFRKWDTSGKGKLGRNEVRRALADLGYDAPKAEVDALVAALGRDGGGEIKYEEMDKVLQRTAEAQSAVARLASTKAAATEALQRVQAIKAEADMAALEAAQAVADAALQRIQALKAEAAEAAKAAAKAALDSAAQAAKTDAAKARAAEEAAAAAAKAAAAAAAAAQAAAEPEGEAKAAADAAAAAAKAEEEAALGAALEAAAAAKAAEEAARVAEEVAKAAAEAAELAEAKAAGAAKQAEGAIRKTHAGLSDGRAAAAGEGKETSAAVAAASAAALTAAAAAEAATSAAGRAEAQRVEAAAAAAAAAEAAYDPEASAEAEEALSEVVLARAASKQAAAEAAAAKGAAEMAAASAADAAAAAAAIDGHPVAELSPASKASVRAAKIATEARTGATNSATAAAAAGSAAADATVGMGVAAAAEAAEAESEAAAAAAEAAEAAEAAWRSADAAAFAARIASQRAAAAEAAAAAAEAATAAVEATSPPEPPAATARPSPNRPSPHRTGPPAARPPPPPYAHPEPRTGMPWAHSHPWAATSGVPPRRSSCAAAAAAAAARTRRAATGDSAGGGAAASTLPVLDWSRRNLASTIFEAAGDLFTAIAAKAPGTLWLHDNEITSEGGAMLGALLSLARGKTARPVRRLGLSGNMLFDTGVEALLQTLSPEVGATLNALGLASNGLGAPSALALANALGEGGKLSGLLELKLGGNNLGDGGGVALARALRSPGCQLHTLHLGFSAVGEAGGVAIAEAIGGVQSTDDAPAASVDEDAAWLPLRSLQLQSNELRTNAAAALAQALRSPRCGLTSLWLGGNTLGASGAAAVADALCFSRSMRQLRLENTGLDDSSASGLAAAIVSPECPIAELWMGGSALTDAGAAVIAGALLDRSEADEAAALASGRGDAAAAGHPRSSLCKLWLDHGSLLRPSGASALVEAARRHGAPLEQLWLGGPAIGPEDAEALLNLGGGAAEGAEAVRQPAVEGAEEGASEAPHCSRPPLRLLLNQQARPALAMEATSTARAVLLAKSARAVAGAAAAPVAEAPAAEAEAPVAEPQPEVAWEAPAMAPALEVTAPEM